MDIFSNDPQRIYLEGANYSVMCRVEMSKFDYNEDECALIPNSEDAYTFEKDMKEKIKSFKIKEIINNFSYLS